MKGSCLCKAIEYEIDSIDMPIAHCPTAGLVKKRMRRRSFPQPE